MTDTRVDFFISYNHADQHWAEWIAWQLEAVGFSTTIQAWDIRPGSNFVALLLFSWAALGQGLFKVAATAWCGRDTPLMV